MIIANAKTKICRREENGNEINIDFVYISKGLNNFYMYYISYLGLNDCLSRIKLNDKSDSKIECQKSKKF